MAREIFITDAVVQEGGGERYADVTFWLAAPANRVRPNAGAAPGIPPSVAVDATNGVSWGYTAAELAAIRSGSVVVAMARISEGEIPQPVTLANFRIAADTKFAGLQTALTASALAIKTIGMARTTNVWGAAP